MSSLKHNTQSVLELIADTAKPGERTLIAIAGPPGSGKSTLAEAVVDRVNQSADPSWSADLLPMDGYHLDTEVLEPMGLLPRRGAPETFDAQGFLDLLKKVRSSGDDIRFPVFDRAQDHSVPDAGLLRAETEVVVVEGNYLLLDQPIWRELHELFDASVFLQNTLETLKQRLMNRWLGLGFSNAHAERKVFDNDLKNAQLVLGHSVGADLILHEPLPKPNDHSLSSR